MIRKNFIFVLFRKIIPIKNSSNIKKRFKKTDELLSEIDKVTLSMEDQAGRALNTEEGMIK